MSDVASIAARLGALGAGDLALQPAGAETWVPRHALAGVADFLATLGLEPQLVVGTDTRAERGDFTLAYVFAPLVLRPRITVFVAVPGDDPTFPSLATRSFAASRFEREIHDLLGLVPAGHPDPRRLALHQFWPRGYFPLRKDVEARTDFRDEGQPFPFRRVEGPGIVEITVGPVHAGVIEPGHFRFSVEGETIVNLESRLGFVHKGVEKLFETLPFARTHELAERISGDESVAHAVAYCTALERLAGCRVPARAAAVRVALLELERLYNHVGDVGMIVNDTGYAWGHAHCFRLREEIMRRLARLTGHRLGRGIVAPGGLARDLADDDLAEVATTVTRLVDEFLGLAESCLDHAMVHERLQGTGRLTERTAREMQVVGLVARASGIDADARRDWPTDGYDGLAVTVAVESEGDVLARTRVRLAEAREAARLLGAVCQRVPPGAVRSELGGLPPHRHAAAVVEAWRGPIWYWLASNAGGNVGRVKVVDPSFRNWPALSYAVLKNIVPDFPLCNKSFNLSYSGNDL